MNLRRPPALLLVAVLYALVPLGPELELAGAELYCDPASSSLDLVTIYPDMNACQRVMGFRPDGTVCSCHVKRNWLAVPYYLLLVPGVFAIAVLLTGAQSVTGKVTQLVVTVSVLGYAHLVLQLRSVPPTEADGLLLVFLLPLGLALWSAFILYGLIAYTQIQRERSVRSRRM